MIKALIWNEFLAKADNYKQLLENEAREGGSMSSDILANSEAHLIEILDSIEAETNIRLNYRIMEEDGKRVNYACDFNRGNAFIVYRGNDYNSYEEADKDGAVYSTGSTIDNLETGAGAVVGHDTHEIVSCVASCLGTENLKAGIMNNHGEFVEIPFILNN